MEEELGRLERAMADGDHAAPTLRRYSEAQARLEHAGGWAWRDRAVAVLRGLDSGIRISTGRSTRSRAAS